MRRFVTLVQRRPINFYFKRTLMTDEKKSSDKSGVPLPVVGRRNILITSALPYVNATPHLGNLIGCVLSADVYSRFARLRGYNVLYVCGTDEYGTATETKAVLEGVTPQEICDKYHKIHNDIYEWFDIRFDIFGRTSTPQQTEITQDIYQRLDANGCIDEQEMKGLFCEQCQTPLADRFVEGECPTCHYDQARGDQCDACGSLLDSVQLINPRCKTCSSPPVERITNHLFLRLTHLTDQLSKWITESSEKGCWSTNSKATTQSWLKMGLQDRCITRDLKWGTPVPRKGYEDKVFYVWFDAPIGYLSITACLTDEWKQWWKSDNVELYQFMGKDNVPFHTVIFPASLIGADDGYTLLHHLNTTEYLLYEGGKFSKTNGVGVFGDDAQNTGIPPSVWRYYLLTNRPESSDSDFQWSDLAVKNNSELLNNLGNLVHRTITFVQNQFGGKIPRITLRKSDEEFLASITKLTEQYIEELEAVKIKAGIRTAMTISKVTNQYLQDGEPWKRLKSDSESAGTTIAVCANIVRLLATLLHPYMPSVSSTIASQLNVSDDFSLTSAELFSSEFVEGHEIGTPQVLFTKIADESVEEFHLAFLGKKRDAKTGPEFPLDLIVGTVFEVKDHPTADHLWVVQVTTGGRTLQIVTSLRTCYDEEQFLNKTVIVLNNIKKSKFQGVASQGMVLCAKDESGFSVVTSTQSNGTRVVPEGAVVKVKKNFKYKKAWKDLNLRTNDESQGICGGVLLLANGEPIFLDKPKPNSEVV
uniref:Methionine--tRNA ligase, cytoplasmic n=3 Tax=Hirondellea gigas TaxID=1518452 RepID=A0A6A7G947_9CRUS